MAQFKLADKIYRIDVEKTIIPTPRLLVFQDRLSENIIRMKQYLEAFSPNTGFKHLYPHVKTHKSSFLVQQFMDMGVTQFKSTPNEVEMLAKAGAKEVFVAYSLLPHNIDNLVGLKRDFPDTDILVQIGCMEHAELLRQCVREVRSWKYYLDMDVGMHRTGAQPEDVLPLNDAISQWEGFEFVGLHGYDGHNHHDDPDARKAESEKSMKLLLDVWRAFREKGITVPRLMTGGSISFRTDGPILSDNVDSDTMWQLTPGNWIYWDTGYDGHIPGQFEIAAAILAQVIEIGFDGRLTLNLGHKRWGPDRGPVEAFSPEGLRVMSFNEEHTVLENTGGHPFKIGDYVMVFPKHSCSTSNLYEAFTLIGKDGEIIKKDVPIDGRNR